MASQHAGRRRHNGPMNGRAEHPAHDTLLGRLDPTAAPLRRPPPTRSRTPRPAGPLGRTAPPLPHHRPPGRGPGPHRRPGRARRRPRTPYGSPPGSTTPSTARTAPRTRNAAPPWPNAPSQKPASHPHLTAEVARLVRLTISHNPAPDDRNGAGPVRRRPGRTGRRTRRVRRVHRRRPRGVRLRPRRGLPHRPSRDPAPTPGPPSPVPHPVRSKALDRSSPQKPQSRAGGTGELEEEPARSKVRTQGAGRG